MPKQLIPLQTEKHVLGNVTHTYRREEFTTDGWKELLELYFDRPRELPVEVRGSDARPVKEMVIYDSNICRFIDIHEKEVFKGRLTV